MNIDKYYSKHLNWLYDYIVLIHLLLIGSDKKFEKRIIILIKFLHVDGRLSLDFLH